MILRAFDGPEGPYEIRTTVEAGVETFTDGWSTSSDIWYRLYAEDADYDRSEETAPIHAPPVP